MDWLEFFVTIAVSPFLQDFINKIKTSAYDQICHAFSDVEKKLKTLEGSYVRAQSLVGEVDGWELMTSQPHREWVGDALRACYDIEDLTVDVMVELRKAGNSNSNSNSLSYLKNWIQSHKIDQLQTNLEAVLARASYLAILDRNSTEPTASTLLPTPRISPLNCDTFLRKRDKEQIVKMLLRSTSIIVSIEGMFGLGKSVLAQAVSEDQRIQDHFNRIFWIPMQDFNPGRVIRSMLSQIQDLERVQDHQLAKAFQSLCQSTSILVVLDGLRSSIRHQDWEEFIALLSNTHIFGVLITTRNPNITKRVSSMTTIPAIPYWLKPITDEVCQSLIISRGLKPTGGFPVPPKRKRCKRERNTLKAAEQICKGLPLVANIFSAHFSSDPMEDCFRKLSTDFPKSPEFKEQIFPAFRQDYSNLPKAVKNCFRYLSLFPENFEFKKQDLVQLWMAEGFIVPKVPTQPYCESLEEIGNQYFDELFSRSILQIYHPFNKAHQVYKMHEFIRQYSKCVGSDVYLRLNKKFVAAHSSANKGKHQLSIIPDTRYNKARHISFLCRSITPSILKDIEKCKSLRTLVSPQEQTHVSPLSYDIFLQLQYLRVLSLSGTDIGKLPESVGKLKHLQLLDVSNTVIEDLPTSTAYLQELRVLKLTDCRELLRLPRDIKMLTNLLHLEINGTRFPSMPPKMGRLKNLRTLSVFIVGDEDGYWITELKNMQLLEGTICLKDLENVTTYAEAKEAMLNKKSQLRKLELEWNSSSIDQSIAEEVLKGLEPHENLEELRVAGYDGLQFPSWLSSPECGLKSIQLQECHKCSSLPSLGQLTCLTHLHIQGMDGIKYVDQLFSAGGDIACLPSLVSLKFEGMKNLENLDRLQATQMPNLHELMITDCPKLVALPSLIRLTSFKKLEICGCSQLLSFPKGVLPSSLESLMIEGKELIQKIEA